MRRHQKLADYRRIGLFDVFKNALQNLNLTQLGLLTLNRASTAAHCQENESELVLGQQT